MDITRILDGATNVTASNVSFVNVSTQGAHTLEYFATDNATNVEATQTFSFGVDSVAPRLNLSLDPTRALRRRLLLRSRTSRPRTARSRAATSPLTGSFRVLARAVDVAGHVRDNRTRLITLDLVGPIIDLVRPEAGGAYAGNTGVTTPFGNETNAAVIIGGTEVVANASDEGSGVWMVELYIDDVLVANDTHAPLRVWVGGGLLPGPHTLRVVARDGAGHEANETLEFVFVGATPPDVAQAEISSHEEIAEGEISSREEDADPRREAIVASRR